MMRVFYLGWVVHASALLLFASASGQPPEPVADAGAAAPAEPPELARLLPEVHVDRGLPPNDPDDSGRPINVLVQAAPCSYVAPTAEGQASNDEAGWALEVEVGLGLGASATGAKVEDGVQLGTIASAGLGTMWSIGVDSAVGRRLRFGGGVTRLSVDDPFAETRNRSLTSGDLRARGFVALTTEWSIELLASAGLTHWSDDGLGSLLGWGTRIGVRGVYRFADGLSAFSGLSYLRYDTFQSVSFGDAEKVRPYPAALATWLLSVGIRFE